MLKYLNQSSTWTGLGSLVGLATIFGGATIAPLQDTKTQVVGALAIALLNVFDVFRNEHK